MVDLVTAQQPFVARGPDRVNTSTAKGLQDLSRAAGNAADTFTIYEEEQAAIQNDLILAKAQEKWTQYLSDTAGGAGAGYVEKMVGEYDQYTRDTLAKAPRRGRDGLEAAFQKTRIRIEARAMQAEAAARARAKAAAVSAARTARANALVSDPSFLDSALEADPANADYYVKVANNARMIDDPVTVGREFRDGKWDAYVSPSEKLAFIKQGKAAEERIAREDQAALAVARKEIADISAEEIAYTEANGAPPVDSLFDEDQVRAIFPEQEAEQVIARHGRAMEFAEQVNAVSTASPAQIDDMMDQVAEDVAAPGDSKLDASRRSTLAQAVNLRQASLENDAALHVLRYNDKVNRYFEAVDGEDAEIAAESYRAALASEYNRLGVPEQLRRVLPKDGAKSMVASLNQADTDVVGLQLKQVVDTWGDPRILPELSEAGLAPEYVEAMRHTDNPGLMQQIASLRGTTATKLREGIEPMELQGFDDTLTDYITDFAEVLFAARDPGAASREWSRAYSVYERLVLARVAAGEGVSVAAERMAGQMFPEAIIDRPGEITVLAPPGSDKRQIVSSLKEAQTEERLKAFDPVNIRPDLDPEVGMDFTVQAARGGQWVTNDTGDGAILMLRTHDGYFTIFRNKDGQPYEVKFGDTQAVAR